MIFVFIILKSYTLYLHYRIEYFPLLFIYSLLYLYFAHGTTKLNLDQYTMSKALTTGIPQGSMLGPYL